MELLKKTFSLVILGGVIAAACGCGPSAPIVLKDRPDGCLWNHSGGSPERSSYSDISFSQQPGLLWVRKFKYPLHIEPTGALGFLLISTPDNKLHVVSANNGDIYAEISFKEPVMAPVVISDSMAVLNIGGYRLMVENWVDRQQLWEADLNGAGGEPLVLGDKLIWLDGMGYLRCFDISQGKRIWDRKIDRTVSAPVSGSELGILIFPDDGVLECFDPRSGRLLWSFDTGARIRNAPVIVEDQVIFCSADGQAARVNLVSGQTVWYHDLKLPVYGPIASDGQGVYFGTNNRFIVRLDFETGDIVWKNRIAGPVKAGPALTEQMAVFTSIDFNVYFVDKASGLVKNKFKTDGMISTRPITCQNKIFVVGEDMNLYCFGLPEE